MSCGVRSSQGASEMGGGTAHSYALSTFALVPLLPAYLDFSFLQKFVKFWLSELFFKVAHFKKSLCRPRGFFRRNSGFLSRTKKRSQIVAGRIDRGTPPRIPAAEKTFELLLLVKKALRDVYILTSQTPANPYRLLFFEAGV